MRYNAPLKAYSIILDSAVVRVVRVENGLVRVRIKGNMKAPLRNRVGMRIAVR